MRLKIIKTGDDCCVNGDDDGDVDDDDDDDDNNSSVCLFEVWVQFKNLSNKFMLSLLKKKGT